MLLESVRRNISHGDRLSQTDKRQVARDIVTRDGRVSEIIGNTNFCIIDNLIAQGREMPYIAGHLNMDLATVWAIKLTDLSDQEKVKALGWGLRT